MAENEKYPEINLGAEICNRLKKLYYPEIEWGDGMSQVIAKLFTKLKTQARIFFPDCAEIELLQKICKFNDISFKELCEL